MGRGREKMVKLTVMIPAELDKKLRKHIEMRRGELSKFITEAIQEKLEKEGGSGDDPVFG